MFMNVAGNLFPLAVLAGIVFVATLIAAIRGKVLRGRLARLQFGLPGQMNRNILSPRFSGAFDGLPFAVWLSTGSDNTPRKLNVAIQQPLPFKLAVLKENLFSDLTKRIGLTKDVQSGDAIFDAEFLLMSDDALAVRTLLSDSATKELIRAVFQLKYAVSLDNRGITASKSYYDPEVDLDPRVIGQLLRCLVDMGKRASCCGASAGPGLRSGTRS